MVERTKKFERAFIAVPIKESPLLSWTLSLYSEKKFTHMTFFFLGEIDNLQLEEIKPLIISAANQLNGAELKPKKLAVLGTDNKSFVVLLENFQKLNSVRKHIEENLPSFKKENLPFTPHVTIKALSNYDISGGSFEKFMSMTDKSKDIDAYLPKSIGVYYRVDGATALLFSQKIT